MKGYTGQTSRASADIVERGRLEEGQLTLQLRLKTGELLETSKSKVILSENRIELGPKEIDGRIRHRGWSLQVPKWIANLFGSGYRTSNSVKNEL